MKFQPQNLSQFAEELKTEEKSEQKIIKSIYTLLRQDIFGKCLHSFFLQTSAMYAEA